MIWCVVFCGLSSDSCSFPVTGISYYLNGHYMVSILLLFPVLAGSSIRYLSVPPLGYRLWDKKQTKLKIAASMVRRAMESIDSDRQAFLRCDSRYPKGCVADLVDE